MKRILLILVFCFFLSASFIAGMTIKERPNITNYCPAFLDKNTDILWALVQNFRLENNLKPYTKNQILCDIANTRAQEIITDFSHDKFLNRFQNYPYLIAENLARYVAFEPDILGGWLNSPSHAKALYASYAYSCIACSNDHCVQIFTNF